MQEPPERPQAANDGASDAGLPPGPQDAGLPPGPQYPRPPPEQPEPGTPPAEPAPDACEGVPSISPQALAEWQDFEDRGDRYISCLTSVPDGGGGAVVLRGDGVTFQISTRGGVLAQYIANGFSATSQPGGMLGISDPLNDDPQWLTFVNAATGEVIQRPNAQAELVMTAVDPIGGLRAVLADGTLKTYVRDVPRPPGSHRGRSGPSSGYRGARAISGLRPTPRAARAASGRRNSSRRREARAARSTSRPRPKRAISANP